MTNNTKHWAAVWGNAMSVAESRPESYSKDITLRYPIYSQFAGDAVRITFDNYTGTQPVTISKTTVFIYGQFYDVTFGGSTSVTIAPGENAVSDPVQCSVRAQTVFFVSFYLADFTQMRSVVFAKGPFSSGAYAIGDQTKEELVDIDITRKTRYVYFLSNVSVHTDKKNRTIVCYGDSITAQDWPDYLSLRCRTEGYENVAVVRRATSGSRVLREYSCITYQSYGLKGEKRFFHEVPTDGADTVIIQQGINDIIHPVGRQINVFRPMSDLPTVDRLIEGLKKYIAQARSFGYRVYMGTLLPIGGWRTYADFREEMRQQVNSWIRTTDLIDGCIDFDKALADPENPTWFLPEYDSGDHLHPSSAGYKAMAAAVMEEILK